MYKNLFSIINITLATILIFFSVKLCYQILSAKLLQVSFPDLTALADPGMYIKHTKTPGGRQKIKNITAYQSITNRDLFKTKEDAKPEKIASDIELEKLQQTSLNLKLFGTITGRNDHDYAVIEDTQKRKQGLYKKGDAIQNAEIKLILRKKIVLSVNGKDEILLMEDDKNNKTQKRKKKYSPIDRKYEESMLDERFDAGEMVSIDREKINSSLKNINQLMSQVKVRPHFKNGKPNGLLLSHVQQNSIFKDMGLQNGDIVKGVNGKEIRSVDDALKFYDNLKSSNSVELQIERQGNQLSINYQIE
ncbi:MAG: PDZ domain-containing protein [Desulfobacteraceae bacterium]|nr:PDZ domain-containing protein [Desulfobacteraceae bacterium]MBC2755768.1 PDZ domain-containing protein [Desulfobacteraceae bacterium]